MIDFLRESDNFAGVTFSGCFNIDMSDLEILYKHYQETGENLTIDHIKPVARGGENKLSNLQPLCKSCNSSKGTQIIDYRDNGLSENT